MNSPLPHQGNHPESRVLLLGSHREPIVLRGNHPEFRALPGNHPELRQRIVGDTTKNKFLLRLGKCLLPGGPRLCLVVVPAEENARDPWKARELLASLEVLLVGNPGIGVWIVE